MFFICTLRDELVYLPRVAKTEAGFYMNCEPVSVISVANADRLYRVLEDVMKKGNAVVPTPKRGASAACSAKNMPA
jgi:hypothetical protein